MDQFNALQILEKMEFFYNNAWNKLMALIGLLGVGVPIVWYFLQRRFFRMEEEKIKKELREQVNKLVDEKSEQTEKVLSQAIDVTIKQAEKRISDAEGHIFFSQGVILQDKGDNLAAIGSYFDALPLYIKAEDECNLQSVLNNLNNCWGALNADDIENLELQDYSERKIIDLLEKYNDNRKYEEPIYKIKKGFKEARKRTAPGKNDSINK